jgi:oxygen-dependent protoporphyrinogen oxidase
MDGAKRVVVAGGGIAGLSAAFYLHRLSKGTIALDVIEPGARLGGKLATARFAGQQFEMGADSYLSRVPWALDLCLDLGINDLVAPATGNAFIWSRGKLRPLRSGPVLGLPISADALIKSGLLSAGGIVAMVKDLAMPRTRLPADISVGGLVSKRLGKQVVERFTDPLLGGVYAGNAMSLSTIATSPRLFEIASSERSLIRSMRLERRAKRAPGPVFSTVPAGLTAIANQIKEAIGRRSFLMGRSVAAIGPLDDGVLVGMDDGKAIRADALVLATPASEAKRLLGPLLKESGNLLDIPYASVAVVALSYPLSAFDRVPRGSGFLVPRVEDRFVTACTFSSTKWNHAGSDGAFLLRASIGRIDDERWITMDDDQIISMVHKDLNDILGVRAFPTDSMVVRWPLSLPQYEVGHFSRMAEVEGALEGSAPRIHLAGAAYRGVGIAACIKQGRDAAERVLTQLRPDRA